LPIDACWGRAADGGQSEWLVVGRQSDPSHPVELSDSGADLITTSLVLIELADGLSRVHHRGLAMQLVDALERSRRVEIVPVDERLERLGWQLFRAREDKDWGMTDCVSMSLMADRRIQDVFTADHHFEQAGFNILLREQGS
jgi:predicted nucleic acid-binding protein